MKKSAGILMAVAVLCLGGLASAKDKKGPVSGAWACVAHGSQQGDILFTLNLTQAEDKVTGHFAQTSDQGGEQADITDGSYTNKSLTLHFDAYGGTVSITGTVPKKGEMSGNWSHGGGGEGTWECKVGAPAASK